VVIQQRDGAGRVSGVSRFVGLFTSKAYAEEAAEIPLLSRVLGEVLAAEHVVPGSHAYKEIVAIFNALPKAELFASEPADVRAQIRAVMAAARGDEVVVSVRWLVPGERVSVLIVMARERYSGEVRHRIRAAIGKALGGTLLDDHLVLGESDRALLHFAFAGVRVDAGRTGEEALRTAVLAIVRSWRERLRDALVGRHGAVDGGRLAAHWAGAFPGDYEATVDVERAADDVGFLAAVEGDALARVALANDEARPTTALRLYLADTPLVLSECMPMLENLGLRALAEDEVAVAPADGRRLWVQTFFVQDRRHRPLDLGAAEPRLSEALLAVLAGRARNDCLNRLVLDAGLDWRAVDGLRTYCGYAAQLGLATRPALTTVLAAHPEPARRLFACFAARLRPGDGGEPGAVRRQFLESLDTVESLREDRLLRALLDIVEATVRTNFFTRDAGRDHVAVKVRARDLVHLPLPRPLHEIYVHAPTMEGIHLRAGRIARGGIRHSDRPDDFRTEVLGLMKTQTVKNAVIVPVGAKGGFVLAGRPDPEAVRTAYATLIRGLLDLTDNVVGGRVVPPPGLVVLDEEDPYLVVAADKGTATFSDLANAIAAEYGFWLGDAFASGGSNGYDHKRLGITARGAWECARTHLREIGLDADHAPVTVTGIGDMGGDVFGNGMLLSRHLRLRAAFNHRHVFLDPDPDPAASAAERERLFRAGRGWDAWDPAVLSPGGAVVERATKRVRLSPEARAMLGLGDDAPSGERLVQAVLGLETDLLFNGGIGTYVGASDETDAEIRDAANDPVRVKARALRARVVVEGGNLGFTQRARVEYALAGGRINTDAVDNSAGVSLSDREVNLKICLRAAVDAGVLGPAARNAFLEALTPDVVARVLAQNRAQSRLLGLDQARSRTRLADFRELVGELERSAGLDRALEALPDRETLRARRATFLGLTRPELAVVMAYAKIHLNQELLASTVPDDPLVETHLLDYFPAAVVERFPDAVRSHPLRREIVATALANAVVDAMGATFVRRVARDTGAGGAEVVRAWAVAWAVAGWSALMASVTEEGHPPEAESAAWFVVEGAGERTTKWILANTGAERPAAEVAADCGRAIAAVRGRLPEWITGADLEAWERLVASLEMAGLAAPSARALAETQWLADTLAVAAVARETGVDAERAAASYWGLGERIDFAWLWARLAEAGEEDRWQRRAVAGLGEDLDRARRRLAGAVLGAGPGALHGRALAVVQALIRDLRAAPRTSLAALEVVVREIRRLAEPDGPGRR
jgi:glutamate dehydrogenase